MKLNFNKLIFLGSYFTLFINQTWATSQYLSVECQKNKKETNRVMVLGDEKSITTLSDGSFNVLGQRLTFDYLSDSNAVNGSSYRYNANVMAYSAGESIQVKIRIEDQEGGDWVQMDSDPEHTHIIRDSGETVISFKGKDKNNGSVLEGELRVGFQVGRLTIGSSSFGLQFCNN